MSQFLALTSSREQCIGFEAQTTPCHLWGRISTTCANEVSKNYIKCNYIFVFPPGNSAYNGLIAAWHALYIYSIQFHNANNQGVGPTEIFPHQSCIFAIRSLRLTGGSSWWPMLPSYSIEYVIFPGIISYLMSTNGWMLVNYRVE